MQLQVPPQGAGDVSDGPAVPGEGEQISVPRDQFIQLLSDLWDANQVLHDKLKDAAALAHELKNRNDVLEQWTRGIGHTSELIALADVVADIAANDPPAARRPGDPRLAKAYEIARRFVAENPNRKKGEG